MACVNNNWPDGRTNERTDIKQIINAVNFCRNENKITLISVFSRFKNVYIQLSDVEVCYPNRAKKHMPIAKKSKEYRNSANKQTLAAIIYRFIVYQISHKFSNNFTLQTFAYFFSFIFCLHVNGNAFLPACRRLDGRTHVSCI